MSQYSEEEQNILLRLARESIAYGLAHHQMIPVDLKQYSTALQALRATFVTLHIQGQLRGCIGSILAHQPLVKDVVHNAYAAAFGDPRFFPLTDEEFKQVELEISILSPPSMMTFQSEEDLISQLRPYVDGLILSDRGLKGTFLPTVWESLPNPKEFLSHLKQKAGLSSNYWSSTIQVERYTAELIK
jgi:uncharacterized protein